MSQGKPSSAGRWALCVAMLVAAAGTIAAPNNRAADPPRYRAALYLWGADIDGATQSGIPVEISFSELTENLDLAFMGLFEARVSSKWSVMADVVYMDVSKDDSGTVSPLGIPVTADVAMTGWVVNLNGARNVYESDHATVNVLFGTRYFDLANDLTATIANRPTTFEAGEKVWDGVVGVRGDITLPKRWFLSYYLDAGTGESDFTWQGFFGAGYAWKLVDVALGYRYLSWEFKSDGDFKDMMLGGPLLGVAFKF